MTATLTLDGIAIAIQPGATILSAARAAGIAIPHLCAGERPGYAASGACRVCLVTLAGEAPPVAACRRPAEPGQVVATRGPALDALRGLVLELTASEMSEAAFRAQSGTAFAALAPATTRFGFRRGAAAPDARHPAITISPDACIRCGLCRTACQDVQVNGVIGLAGSGDATRVTFDLDRPLADSGCVACGECVQACPTAALAPASHPLAARAARPVARSADTVCPFCSVGCRIALRFDADGGLLRADGADGPANHDRLCVKGRFGLDHLRHAERLTVPLVRRDGVPRDAALGAGPGDLAALFRPATWDEALDRAAAGLRAIRDRDGGAALAVLGSAKTSNEDAYLLQKLARGVLGTAHVDHCTRLCASVPPLAEAIGFSAVTAPVESVLQADVALMVGSNPEVNHPVAASIMKNAVRRGTRLILVDPWRQPFARHAAHHLQIRPGTDVALLSAMTHVVIAEGLYDRRFVAERVDGFETLAERVAAYPPALAARLCGVPAETIVAAARLFATARAAMCFWGMGASQHVHGADNIRALIALALICGQVGRPGAGLHPLRGQNNVQGSCDAGMIPTALPGYRGFDDAESVALFRGLWGAAMPAEPGLTVVEILDAVAAGRIKGLHVMGGNPAMANPDLAATRRALARLEHLVVQDIFPTETAAFADVILPAAALAEREGSVTSTDRFVQHVAAALPAPGEARPDHDILHDLGNRLGAGWGPPDVGATFDEMAGVVPALAGLTWERLVEARSLRYPVAAATEPSLFADAFPRANGRARLVALGGRRPAEPPDADYPLVLVTGRVREHWHTGSMTRRARVLDALSPAPLVHATPGDLARLGIADGAWARIETRRGAVRLRAAADPGLQPGVIWMAMSFFEAAANDLTHAALDDTTRVPEYKYCAARLLPAGD